MKRLITFYNSLRSDIEFSACSTKFEVLPELVDAEANTDTLRLLASKHGYKDLVEVDFDPAKGWHAFRLSCIYKTDQVDTTDQWGELENTPIYIAFLNVDTDGPLEPIKAGSPKDITADQLTEIVNSQAYGVLDTGMLVDGGSILIAAHWELPVHLRLLGYSPESLYEAFEHTGFEDDTFSCHECGMYDDQDNGYTLNHRIVDECILVGINCGCYAEYANSEKALEDYTDEPTKAMELESAEVHEEAGRLKHVTRYIGGMLDGRGGSYAGESCEEGQPEAVFAKLKKANPNKHYVFSHDESGQFQTYWSVWEVAGE